MKVDEKFGLKQKTISSLWGVFAKYPQIEKVILYGSRAKGTHKPGSDIDLTIISPSMTLSQLMAIENEIEALGLAYKVDLSLHHKIDTPSLLEHINQVGVAFELSQI